MPQASTFQSITCPYCFSEFSTEIETTIGTQDLYEDCQVCCAPVELIIHIDDTGTLTRIETKRGNS